MADEKGFTRLQELVHELKVGDVMTTELITVSPKARMSDLRSILREHRISGLPVVDADRMVGIVSIEDFIKSLADNESGCLIEEKMTRSVETVCADDPLVVAISKLEQRGWGRLPVIERDSGELVGILTKGDVIRGLLKKLEVEYHEEEIHHYRASHIFEDIEADATTLVFQYDVKGKDFKHAGAGSSRLRRTLLRLGIPPQIVRRVAIASYEAEMNVIFFTDGGVIRVQVRRRRVLVEVRDSGPGIADIEQAMQPGFSRAPDWVRELGFGAGMGLPNIKKMSDEFEITSEVGKGTLLKLTFYTEQAAA